jgi:monofunctional glycosyltransferase
VDDRGHDREWDGGDPATARTAEPTGSEPSPPAPAVPLVIWPRAAGGGAGAVAAPGVEIGPRPADAPAHVPEMTPAPPMAAPPPEVAAIAIPDLADNGDRIPPPAEQVCDVAPVEQVCEVPPADFPVDTSETLQTTPIQPIEPTAIGDDAAAVPPQPVASLEPLPAAPPFSPPQPDVLVPRAVPVPALPPAPWREARLPPSIPTKVEPPRTLRRALRFAAFGLIAFAGAVLALIVLYRWVDPPASTLMLGQRLGGTPIVQRWVPLTRISPNLPLAVILSEDARFCRHAGVDWGELKEAIETAGDGVARGGSTISMQVVKNLFLWPSKSYLRKAIEIPLAYLIEVAWSKQRILEIYLNIAEWGPGVFGAEAAARYHFRKPAALLGPREAALLAVSLPNPFERDAGSPGPGTQRLADNLLLRMRAARATPGCARARSAGGTL